MSKIKYRFSIFHEYKGKSGIHTPTLKTIPGLKYFIVFSKLIVNGVLTIFTDLSTATSFVPVARSVTSAIILILSPYGVEISCFGSVSFSKSIVYDSSPFIYKRMNLTNHSI